MSVDKMIKENNEFVSRINEYYVNCYTLNNDRLADMAAHGISLRKQLIEAIKRISELTAALEAATNKETQP